MAGKPWKFTPEKKEAFLETLRQTGSRNQAYKTTGVGRTCFSGETKRDPEFAQAVNQALADYDATCIETIEKSLFGKAKAGNLGAMIFFLCNRAPDRWKQLTRYEHTGAGGTLLFGKMTDDELRGFIAQHAGELSRSSAGSPGPGADAEVTDTAGSVSKTPTDE